MFICIISRVMLCDSYSYFLVQLEGACLGTIINPSSFPLILFSSIYPDFPIMHNVMIQTWNASSAVEPFLEFMFA